MKKTTSNLRPFSRLSADEDPLNVGSLIRSAQEAPDEDLPRLRWRLRASLRQPATRPRRFLRMALVAGGIFLVGGVVGATVMQPFWRVEPTSPAATAEPPAKAKRPTRKHARASAEASPSLLAPAEPPAVSDEALDTPAANAPAASSPMPTQARRPERRASVPPEIPAPQAATEAPVAKEAPSPVAVEQLLLGDVLKSLRTERNPRGALALLDEHAKRFPGTVLGPEVGMLRAEALFGLGRNAEALSVLDRLSLGSMPGPDDRLVLRGELRAAAGRWREAREDFDTHLAARASSGTDAKARDTTERALWGRASARSHLGDHADARADLILYLRLFPSGRFATQAATLLHGSP